MNEPRLIEIDGAFGEGGGQILRTALGLSTISQNAVRIFNIRAGRAKPGLRNQHLCAVNAAAEICEATVAGANIGSGELQFWPKQTKGGEFVFRIGTAGSCTLVAQTILIPLLHANTSSTITVEGGTHNPFAPPYEFFARSFLPLVNKMGFAVDSALDRHGFYPNGGGKVSLKITPTSKTQLHPIKLNETGKLISIRVIAIVANLPPHIANRELDVFRRKSNWRKAKYEILELTAPTLGTANLVLVELNFEKVTEVVVELGRQGIRAEKVAANALQKANAFLATKVPVGEYLCDQLLLPAAIVAADAQQQSEFVTGRLSLHASTHIDLLQRLLKVQIGVEETAANQFQIKVSPN